MHRYYLCSSWFLDRLSADGIRGYYDYYNIPLFSFRILLLWRWETWGPLSCNRSSIMSIGTVQLCIVRSDPPFYYLLCRFKDYHYAQESRQNHRRVLPEFLQLYLLNLLFYFCSFSFIAVSIINPWNYPAHRCSDGHDGDKHSQWSRMRLMNWHP